MSKISNIIIATRRLLLLVFLAVLSQGSVAASPILQDEFAVGDIVEFKYLRDQVQGEITGFTGTGWPTIEFEYKGRENSRFMPPSRLTLVRSAEEIRAAETKDSPSMTEGTAREWSDATGEFSITAKLIRNQAGNVELEKADGLIVNLPLSKLSQADQDYLANLKNQNSADNPFAGGEKSTNSKPTRSEGSASHNNTSRTESLPVTAITPDSKLNEVVLTRSTWGVVPDVAVQSAAMATSRVLSLMTGFTKYKVHNRAAGVCLSTNGQYVATATSNPFDKATEIVLMDLMLGTSGPALRLPFKDITLVAVTSDGKRVVTMKKGNGRTPGSLDFWDLGDEAIHSATWNTASFFDRTGFAPTRAKFLDDSRLLTLGRKVTLWDCEDASSIYSFKISDGTHPAVSPNLKQVAAVSNGSVYIVDANTGESMGSFEPPSGAQVMAFSPNGQFLAGMESGTGGIWLWDLKINQLVKEMSAGSTSAMQLRWVGEQYLLVNNSDLIDVGLAATVWKYSTRGTVVGRNDGRFWLRGKDKLTPVSLPHKNLETLTSGVTSEELVVLGPGTAVSIEMDLPFTVAEKNAIQADVKSMLAANGAQVRIGSDLKLVMSITKGAKEKREMSSITDPFGRRGTEAVKYSPNNATISLRKNGVVVWQVGTRFGPGGMITLEENESAQAAVTRLCRPDPEFFKTVKMPKFISQFPNGKPLGSSSLVD
ncbi:MAG: WD40 repeat protein [Mariniblastus sp.]|jgi:WD40 repeat protein